MAEWTVVDMIINMHYPGATDIQKYSGDDIASITDLGFILPDSDDDNRENVVSPYICAKMKKKECYSNAVNMAAYLAARGFDVRYAEGFVTHNKEFPIEHGFIIVIKDGHRYIIDPTFEIARGCTKEELQDEDYYVIREYTGEECNRLALKYQVYGPWIFRDTKLRTRPK